jgi:hypothetical protein
VTGLRRDPASVFAAHSMDPSRCELYVEGVRDRRFLNWLVGSSLNPNAIVHEIDVVDLPDIAVGGQRERVLVFGRLAEQANIPTIRCFVDADMDRMINRAASSNVWLTDGRDLESYCLCRECVDKAWRLGVNANEVDAEALLEEVLRVAFLIGELRYASYADDLDLPFRSAALYRHTTVADRKLRFSADSFARALFQRAERPLSGVPAFLRRATELADALDAQRVLDFVHGKDAFDLLTELMHAEGVSRADAPRLLWTSFEKSLCVRHSNLTRVAHYLETCDAA